MPLVELAPSQVSKAGKTVAAAINSHRPPIRFTDPSTEAEKILGITAHGYVFVENELGTGNYMAVVTLERVSPGSSPQELAEVLLKITDSIGYPNARIYKMDEYIQTHTSPQSPYYSKLDAKVLGQTALVHLRRYEGSEPIILCALLSPDNEPAIRLANALGFQYTKREISGGNGQQQIWVRGMGPISDSVRNATGSL